MNVVQKQLKDFNPQMEVCVIVCQSRSSALLLDDFSAQGASLSVLPTSSEHLVDFNAGNKLITAVKNVADPFKFNRTE